VSGSTQPLAGVDLPRLVGAVPPLATGTAPTAVSAIAVRKRICLGHPCALVLLGVPYASLYFHPLFFVLVIYIVYPGTIGRVQRRK